MAGLAVVGLIGAAVLSREPIPAEPAVAPAQPVPSRADVLLPAAVSEPAPEPVAAPVQPEAAPAPTVAATRPAPRPLAVAPPRPEAVETPTVARESVREARSDWEQQRRDYERARFAYQAREKQEGFRWARQNRLSVSRYCDQRTAAFAEGCRDYVRIAEQEG